MSDQSNTSNMGTPHEDPNTSAHVELGTGARRQLQFHILQRALHRRAQQSRSSASRTQIIVGSPSNSIDSSATTEPYTPPDKSNVQHKETALESYSARAKEISMPPISQPSPPKETALESYPGRAKEISIKLNSQPSPRPPRQPSNATQYCSQS